MPPEAAGRRYEWLRESGHQVLISLEGRTKSFAMSEHATGINS